MNWFVVHIASGDSLYSGIILVVSGLTLATGWGAKLAGAMGKISTLIGAVLIYLSSAPALLWVGLPLGIAVLCWVWVQGRASVGRRLLLFSRLALGVCCAIMVLLELPHRWPGAPPQVKHGKLYVIGDSISAGIDEKKANWPGLLQEECRAKIINLARPAATLSTGLKQAAQIPDESCLVLIELGGNDLLSKASATEFENDLGKLLTALEKPGRTLVMFELPLLPGQFLVGRSQRSTARAHTCYLIPKRFFASVFAGPEATIDGLHLSPNGNDAMAQVVKDNVGPLLEN